MKLNTILEYLEQLAPKELAEEWDNVGLLIGRNGDAIERVLVCLDFTADILEQAISQNCQMIITHHPVIFKPLKSLTNPLFLKAAAHNICVYSCHTNLDIAVGGVNEALAEKLGLFDVQTDGILRFGTLDKEMTIDEFVSHVKLALGVPMLRFSFVEKSIRKVGVVGGSGGDFLSLAVAHGCDAFVTGEASYHEAQTAMEQGLLLICAGHFETEVPVVPVLARKLADAFEELTVIAADCKNPFPVI